MAQHPKHIATNITRSLLRANPALRPISTPTAYMHPHPDEWYPGSALFMNDEVADFGAEPLR